MPVRKRGGQWYYDIQIRRVRYRGVIPEARTKWQAEQAEARIRLEIFEGRYGKRLGTASLAEFIEKTYMPWAQVNKRSWKTDYHNAQALIQYFGAKTFQEISPLTVEKFKSDRLKRSTVKGTQRRPASVNRELEMLSKVFNMAVDNGLAETNPCRRVKKLRADNQRNRYLSQEEEKRLLTELTGPRAQLLPIVTVALGAGMRRGEILKLRWRHLDFVRGVIHVTDTKTGRDRSIPMSGRVKGVLLTLRSQSKADGGDYVFTGSGREGRRVEVKRAFASACRAAGIEDFRFHDLRHTFATRLGDLGYNVTTIAALLGHSTIQMSARYTHATDGAKRSAVEAVTRSANVVEMPAKRAAAGNGVTTASQDKNGHRADGCK